MSVVLDIQGCDAAAEIVRLVELELDEPVAVPPAPVPNEAAGGTRIAVACEATLARVHVTAAGESVARTVVLADTVPGARARLIALAAVELVSTTKGRPPAPVVVAQPPPPPAPPAPVATIEARPVPAPVQHDLRVSAFGGGRIFGSDTGLLGGGGVRLANPGARVGWLVDVATHRGESDVPHGRVTVDVIDASVAVSFRHAVGPVELALAGGLRGGMVRLAGESDEMVKTDTFWAPWFGGLALANAEVRIAPRIATQVTIEGGRVISPVGALVDEVNEVGIDGNWFGIHLGIGIIL